VETGRGLRSLCPDAAALLRELANDDVRVQHLGDYWVDAIAQFNSQEARSLLLSFSDPTLAFIERADPSSPRQTRAQTHRAGAA